MMRFLNTIDARRDGVTFRGWEFDSRSGNPSSRVLLRIASLDYSSRGCHPGDGPDGRNVSTSGRAH